MQHLTDYMLKFFNPSGYSVFSLMFIFFLSFLMMSKQLITIGYFSCNAEDTKAFTSWAWQFNEAVKEGVLYPRWMPLTFWEYGSPTFLLYSPFAFYLVSFFNVFTGSVITAMNYTKFFSLFISGIGMFFLIREIYNEKLAFLASCLYIMFPYNIFGYYVIGTFSSMISTMWFAPQLFFLYRFFQYRRTADVLLAGYCFGGLIITHLLNAYMFTFVILSFIMCSSFASKKPKDIIIFPAVLFIGGSLSSAYLLPLIVEIKFVNLSLFAGHEGRFNFADYFILPNLTGKFDPLNFWPYFYKEFVFYVIFLSVLVSIAIFQLTQINKHHIQNVNNVVQIYFIGVIVSCIFLLFGISNFIWESIPFFKYIQFPTRWLMIASFASILILAGFYNNSVRFYKTKFFGNLFLFLIFIISSLLSYKYISAAPVFSSEELLPVTSVNWTPEHLPAGVDIYKLEDNDYLKKRPVIIEGTGTTIIEQWKSAERVIKIAANEPLRLRIRTFNFPGWTAFVDGVQTSIKSEEGTGAMIVDVPSGDHSLKIIFRDTPVRFYSKIVSLISFILLIIFLLYDKLKSMHRFKQEA